jgi:hypothetical protein
MIRRSLTTRLLVALVAVQASAIMLAMIVFPLVAPFVSFSEIADNTFRGKIEHAIVRDAAGGLSVQGDAALARYRAKRPTAAFAVMSLSDGRVVGGSDPELARRLGQIRSLAPRAAANLVTDLPSGATLIITTVDTQHGRLLFATTGNKFYLEDWPSLMAVFPVLWRKRRKAVPHDCSRSGLPSMIASWLNPGANNGAHSSEWVKRRWRSACGPQASLRSAIS